MTVLTNARLSTLARSRRSVLASALAAASVAIGAKTARAAAAISLSKVGGTVGSSISVTLSGFGASESVDLLWFDGAVSKTLVTVTANGTGSATTKFTVPSAVRGLHTIKALGGSGLSASASFKVYTSVRLSPSSGLPTTMVSVFIKGYAPGVLCQVYWFATSSATSGSHLFAVGTTNSKGERKITFQVPYDELPGDHRVEVRPSGGATIAVKTFTVFS